MNWIDQAVSEWRAYILACNHIRVAEGEIPAAQAPMLADMSANKLRAMLVNGESTRLKVAEEVFKRCYGDGRGSE